MVEWRRRGYWVVAVFGGGHNSNEFTQKNLLFTIIFNKSMFSSMTITANLYNFNLSLMNLERTSDIRMS